MGWFNWGKSPNSASEDRLLLAAGSAVLGACVATALTSVWAVRKISEAQPRPLRPIEVAENMVAPAASQAAQVASRRKRPIQRQKVTVRVPATSANLGPGFDCLGMAVDMWSEITVERSDKFEMVFEGEGSGDIPADETNLVCEGLKYAFRMAGEEVPPLKYHCKNRIPFARGLGSSSAAIVGGIIAGLALTGQELSVWGSDPLNKGGRTIEPEELLQMAATIEGHPDNVCPAIYGGIQLGIKITDMQWRSARIPTPHGMQLVAFIPNMIGKTSELRAVLLNTVSRDEAVFNVSRAAFLINALSTNNWGDLRFGTQDALHQPQRSAKYKHLEPVIKAALEAGAHGAFLSGAGPTILAITSGAAGDTFAQMDEERSEKAVADAMLKAARGVGVDGRVFITRPSDRGAHLVDAVPSLFDPVSSYPGML